MMDISSRSLLSDNAFTTFPKYMQNACLASSGSSSRLEWISGSLAKCEAALRIDTLAEEWYE